MAIVTALSSTLQTLFWHRREENHEWNVSAGISPHQPTHRVIEPNHRVTVGKHGSTANPFTLGRLLIAPLRQTLPALS